MKQRIAESALVISNEDATARVKLVGGETCRKCGLAAMGLCKPGGTGMQFTVVNRVGAKVGDKVVLGLDSGVRATGYTLAYAVPLAVFLLGILLGAWLSELSGIVGLDALLGVLALVAGVLISYRRLKIMDSQERMFVSRVIHDVPEFAGMVENSEAMDYMNAYSGGPAQADMLGDAGPL